MVGRDGDARAADRGGLPVLGWREWVRLPELGIERVKAKVDTGAASSSLHAVGLERFERDGRPMVRFRVHPRQRSTDPEFELEAPLREDRKVRPSTGRSAVRPVIVTQVEVMGRRWPVEITLANRHRMGFRMLLGRQALRGRFLVDPAASFLAGGEGRRARGGKGRRAGGGPGPGGDAGAPDRPDPTDPPLREPPPGTLTGTEEDGNG